MLGSSEPAGLQPKQEGTPGTVSGFQPSGGIASTAGAELPQEDKGAMESEACIQPACDTSIGPPSKKQRIETGRCGYLSGAIAQEKESTAPAAPFWELSCHLKELREYGRPPIPSSTEDTGAPPEWFRRQQEIKAERKIIKMWFRLLQKVFLAMEKAASICTQCLHCAKLLSFTIMCPECGNEIRELTGGQAPSKGWDPPHSNVGSWHRKCKASF